MRHMRRTVITVLIVGIAIIACALIVWKSGFRTISNAPTARTAQVEWKTYTNPDTGFTISYPSQYVIDASPAPTGDWGSRSLLIVDDTPNSTSTKPRAVPMTVGLQKQPIVANGEIYHSVAEYQQSGAAAQVGQGSPNPNGELTTVNGTSALLYHIPPADSTGIGADEYIFIHNDLLYEVGINPSDPFAVKILDSVRWQ